MSHQKAPQDSQRTPQFWWLSRLFTNDLNGQNWPGFITVTLCQIKDLHGGQPSGRDQAHTPTLVVVWADVPIDTPLDWLLLCVEVVDEVFLTSPPSFIATC